MCYRRKLKDFFFVKDFKSGINEYYLVWVRVDLYEGKDME